MRTAFKWYCVMLAMLMASATICPGQTDTDWPGWRGLSKQGRSETNGPVTWSSDSNVTWKTDLPGQGHSSPIVVDNNIIVTAAYPVAHGQKTKLIGMYILLTLVLLLMGSSAPCIFRYCRGEFPKRNGYFRSILMFCMLIGLLLHVLTLLTQRISHIDHRSLYVIWLQSFMLAGIGIALVITILPNKSQFRMVLGILAMILTVPLILLRPKPEYYVMGGNGYHLRPTYLTIVLLISVGSATLIGTFLRRRKSKNGCVQQLSVDKTTKSLLPPAAFMLVFVCGFFGLGVTYWVPMMQRRGWLPIDWRVWLHWEALLAIGCCLCIAPWCLTQVFSKKLSPVRPHRLFSPGVLTLILLCLLVANYVGNEESFIRAIICVDRVTGTVKWQCNGLEGPKATTHSSNSPATPTPVIHRGKVYAYFGSPGMMCTDIQGNLLWSDCNLPYEGIHGVGSSLVADSDHIIVTSLNSKAPYITALHAETGKHLWKVNLPGWTGIHGEHRTPLIADLHNTKVLLNWNKKYNQLAAFELDSGRQLWSFQPVGMFVGEAVAGIIQKENTLFLPSRNDIAAVDISDMATSGTAREIWRTNMRSKGPVTPSPVLHNGLIFMVSDQGHASCLDVDTGDLLWQEKLPGQYLASPIVMGQNVYFCSTSGMTTIIACDRTYRQVAQNKLPDGIYATPAPVDGHLYIRTTVGLWCIE
ncbi:MAG: PQQ-like beta-propeller repeat protein [Sedimentisphaerales bacterium]|nr:PQQ-like beta-propeller repeat protein [Sedimentisphaerales bacterium]